MLSAKFGSIWSSCFRGKTSLETIPLYINLTGDHVNEAEMPVAIINNQKQELPLAAIFVGGMGRNEETL
jgi:hypothetical protein